MRALERGQEVLRPDVEEHHVPCQQRRLVHWFLPLGDLDFLK